MHDVCSVTRLVIASERVNGCILELNYSDGDPCSPSLPLGYIYNQSDPARSRRSQNFSLLLLFSQ